MTGEPKIQTSPPLEIQTWPIDRLVLFARNPRKNDAVIDRMCSSIREFGFKIPVLARSDGEVVDGHLRIKAARKLGIDARIAKDHGLKTRWERLRETGMLRLDEMAQRLGICTDQVKAWRAAGLLLAHLCNDKNEYLYEDPGPNPPRVGRGAKLPRKGQINENTFHHASEVQCEA